MPQTARPDRRRDDRVASRRGARARRRGDAHAPPRGPGSRPRRVGVPVGLKCELLQPIGAFKIRGAYNALARLAAAGGARGVVAASSGNHGQALAFAARHFGLRAVVVMPESTPQVKVDGVRRHGGEVVLAGATRSAEQGARAEAIAREEGLAMIPPFDHPDVIAGQGTIGLEILEQRPDVETILVPVSGGGLISGISVAVAALAPAVEVIGVEPEGAAKLTAALAAGAPHPAAHREHGRRPPVPVRRHPDLRPAAPGGAPGHHRDRGGDRGGRPVPAPRQPSSAPSRPAPWRWRPCSPGG